MPVMSAFLAMFQVTRFEKFTRYSKSLPSSRERERERVRRLDLPPRARARARPSGRLRWLAGGTPEPHGVASPHRGLKRHECRAPWIAAPPRWAVSPNLRRQGVRPFRYRLSAPGPTRRGRGAAG